MATTALEEVLQYKNEAVVLRFMETWDLPRRDADDLFEQMNKWLWICAVSGTDPAAPRLAISPSTKLIDEMWHTFILFTQDYVSYCERYFGRYLHHAPTPQSEYHTAIDSYERDPDAHMHSLEVAFAPVMSEPSRSVVLISMPWALLDLPSIPLGILTNVLRRADIAPVNRAYNLAFLEHVNRARSLGEPPVALSAYQELATLSPGTGRPVPATSILTRDGQTRSCAPTAAETKPESRADAHCSVAKFLSCLNIPGPLPSGRPFPVHGRRCCA